LSDTAQVLGLEYDQEKVVIIFNVAGREVGLLAGMPVDVLDAAIVLDEKTLHQTGIQGSAILDGNTTLMLNVPEIITTVDPSWVMESEQVVEQTTSALQNEVILLAEDSDFFRGQVKRYLEGDGYAVLAAPDGQEAWELLKANAGKVQLVVTDIEMPRLDGLGLTRAIRTDQRFINLPIIALTSLASDEDKSRGLEAGVTSYQIKLDRDALLEAVRNLLNGMEASGIDAS
jgi:two-component system chemotaxis sensor kinase CheA